MLRNYFKVALRQFKKNPGYSFINISGLAIGMACFILITLWVSFETGYDSFFDRSDQIYRVTTDVNLRSGQKKFYAMTSPLIAGPLKNEYPETLAVTRLRPARQVLLKRGSSRFFEDGFLFADADFFTVFPTALVSGNAAHALVEPYSLLLSEKMARKYFGDENPLGQSLLIDADEEYRVTGIFSDLPANTHFQLDFLACPGEDRLYPHPSWMGISTYTYVCLKKNISPDEFENRIQELAEKYIGPNGKEIFQFRLQPMTAIHLHSNLELEFAPVTSVIQVYLMSAVAFLVIVIACINFINLTTARSSRRAREVGMRKVLGAHRRRIGIQFLMESLLSSLAAFVLSLVLVQIILPFFNTLSRGSLDFKTGTQPLFFLGLALIVGIVSGLYPASILSSYEATSVLGRRGRKGSAGTILRKALTVFQFSMTIILLIATGTVFQQMRFVKNKHLGFDKEQIVSIRVRDQAVMRNYEGIKSELLQNPRILNVSASSSLPGFTIAQSAYTPEGFDSNAIMVLTLWVDHDFLPTLGIRTIEGRNFSPEFSSDTKTSYIINEAARERFGWKSAVGKTITSTNSNEEEKTASGKVIGVVQNFHLRSLHQTIEPLILRIFPERFQFMNCRVNTDELTDTMKFIRNKFENLAMHYPFEHWFLDSRFDSLYRNDMRMGSLFGAFTIIAVFIACLGLFGLASYLAEQRTKEIGIRKVLGASLFSITWLFTREYSRWIILSNLIAWPVAFVAMQKWLENFAYRTQIPFWLLLLSGLTALALALFTVSFQAVKAGLANPADSLRHE